MDEIHYDGKIILSALSAIKPYKFCISVRNSNSINVLYHIIKQKRDNAQRDLHKGVAANKIEDVKVELIGQVNAYNDILSLMESMFGVKENAKED